MSNSVKSAEKIAVLLDSQFELFGIRFGLDPIFSLIPGLGDIVANLLGVYILFIAWRANVPFPQILIMVYNLLMDILIGGIPVLGDIFDIYYKANLRNLAILKKYT